MKKDAGGKPKSDFPAADMVTKPTPPYADETFGHGRDGRPALCMTIHAANNFCEWLSARTGKKSLEEAREKIGGLNAQRFYSLN